MKTSLYDVYLAKCPDYSPKALDSIVAEAASMAGFPDIEGLRVLVKPNLLNASPAQKAVTTHPEFLSAVLRFIRTRKPAEVLVGDSPAWQSGASAARTSGLWQAAAEQTLAALLD